MKRMTLIAALLAVTVSSNGCCICNWMRRTCAPAPAPVACCPAPAPVCAPAPMCDPCATAPVTYGTPMPVAPYTPPPQW